MATKLVNGARVKLSAEELATIEADWAASDARPAPVPALVPKLALVRAMRLTPFGGGTTWDAVKAGLAAAAADTQEDWQIATHMPRADADLNAMAVAIAGEQAGAMLDALFTLADQIDRGVTGGKPK